MNHSIAASWDAIMMIKLYFDVQGTDTSLPIISNKHHRKAWLFRTPRKYQWHYIVFTYVNKSNCTFKITVSLL